MYRLKNNSGGTWLKVLFALYSRNLQVFYASEASNADPINFAGIQYICQCCVFNIFVVIAVLM